MKKGAPITAVRTDIGISEAVRVLASVSIITTNMLPRMILNGMTNRLLLPQIMRAQCGTSSPTQPTCPHIETHDAVTIVDATTIALRVRCTFIPAACASSSLNVSILRRHLRAVMAATPIAKIGRAHV